MISRTYGALNDVHVSLLLESQDDLNDKFPKSWTVIFAIVIFNHANGQIWLPFTDEIHRPLANLGNSADLMILS